MFISEIELSGFLIEYGGRIRFVLIHGRAGFDFKGFTTFEPRRLCFRN